MIVHIVLGLELYSCGYLCIKYMKYLVTVDAT